MLGIGRVDQPWCFRHGRQSGVAAAPIPSDDLETGEQVWLTADELEAHLQEGDVATLGVAAATLLALPQIRLRHGRDNAVPTT